MKPFFLLPAIFIVSIVLFPACYTSPQNMPGRTGYAWLDSLPSPYLGRFDALWQARTIIPSGGGGRGGSFLPFGGSDEQGGGAGPFPVQIHATFMDSALMNAGIDEFSQLAAMNGEQRGNFRSAYIDKHHAGDSIVVWMVMQTSNTEDFLRLDRWTIFIENQDNRQFEPGRIIEHPLEKTTTPGNPARDESYSFFTPVRKEVELHFPPNTLLNPSEYNVFPQTLKFVMLDTKYPQVRVEGEWKLPFRK